MSKRRDVLFYDDLDSRREIYRLLGHPRMDARRRMSFVQWCCRHSGDKLVQVKPQMKGGVYTTHEAVMDMSMLTMQYRLDIDKALAELTRRVRRL